MPTDPYFNDLRYRYTYGFKTPVETPYDRMLRLFGPAANKHSVRIPIIQDNYLSEEGLTMKNPFKGIKIGDKVKVTYYPDGSRYPYTSILEGEVTDFKGVTDRIIAVYYRPDDFPIEVFASRVKKIKVIEKALPKVGDKITEPSDLERLPIRSVVSRGGRNGVWYLDGFGEWTATSGAIESTGQGLLDRGEEPLVVLRVGGEL